MLKFAEKSMKMSEEVWARHASPWSVWTRFATLPFLALAIWSRAWIGWYAMIPSLLLILWTWLNPRIFPVPAATNNWASKATFGERILLNKKVIPIPHHHAMASMILSTIAGTGMIPFLFGLYVYNFWITLCGMLLIYLGKMWFLDRMVWLYEDMRQAHPSYAAWLKEKRPKRGVK